METTAITSRVNGTIRFLFAALFLGGICLAEDSRLAMQTDTDKGITTIAIDGNTVIVYRHGEAVDLPHFYPWNSPSGRNMVIDKIEPYPHHRAFWVAEDRVLLEGETRRFSNYYALGTGVAKPEVSRWQVAPYHDRSKHVAFENIKTTTTTLEFDETILWLAGDTKIADELRHYKFTALDEGEYFLDFSFKVVAAYGTLSIISDLTHYAWPYIRMNDTFNVDVGKGVITNSEGQVGQGATDQRPAVWIDYSAPTPDGKWEGLACFLHPSETEPITWLTRAYGCWGPNRQASQHNTTFEVPKGEALVRRIGLFIHNGDVNTGNVAERYGAYCNGEL